MSGDARRARSPGTVATRRLALGWASAGSVALVASGALASEQVPELLRSYFVAWSFGLTVGLGALFFVLTQHLTRAGWSVPVRRVAEQLTVALPLSTLLFAPIALGAERLWGERPALFEARSWSYLLLWSGLAWWFRSRSLRQDRSGEPRHSRAMRSASAPALLLLVLTVTFAAFDWLMSFDAPWYSTVLGIYVLSGAAVGGCAALIVAVVWSLHRGGLERGGLERVVSEEHLHDLGKLLFAFTVFWAYIAYSQFMLIWYGNLPEETAFYARRFAAGWLGPTRLLVVAHFVLPFFFLLPRRVKRRSATLLAAALWMLLAHVLDMYWLVLPAGRPGGPTFGFADVGVLAGVAAVQVAAFLYVYGRHPPIPIADPRLAESARERAAEPGS